MEWIKCSDRMPDDGPVIGFEEETGDVYYYHYDAEEDIFVFSNFMGEHVCDHGDVTHWMPLPPPPTE